MHNPEISMIAAVGENRELGKDNKLLWRIPEDATYFKDVTMGHPVIMGSRTYESIPERFRPLPGRENIVISRQKDYHPNGAIKVESMEDALENARKIEEGRSRPRAIEPEIFIIGGAQIYALGLPFADRLYITLVHKAFPDADAFFPDYSGFKLISERNSKDENYTYSFQILERPART